METKGAAHELLSVTAPLLILEGDCTASHNLGKRTVY